MIQYMHRSHQDRKLRILSVVIGIAVNFLLAFITNRTGMPVYLDTVGTFAVAALDGVVPGIMTAIMTNTICLLFHNDSLYFGIVNVLIAIATAWFVRNRSFRKPLHIIGFVLMCGILSGGLSALIQWGLLGGPQNAYMKAMLDAAANLWSAPRLLLLSLSLTLTAILIASGMQLYFTNYTTRYCKSE